MGKFLKAVAAVVIGAGTVSSVLADQVITNSGDTITGTVTTAKAGSLTIHSDSLGDVAVPLAQIRTFSTVKPIEVELSDGTDINAQAEAAGPGDISLAGAAGVQNLPISSIDWINPQPFTASVLLGATLTRGNTFTDSINAGLNLDYRIHSEELSFTGEYLYGKTKTLATGVSLTTTDRLDLDGKYQHFFSKKFYGYAEAEYTKDRIALLQYRFTPSVGLGYQWFDKAPLTLNTEAGAAYIYQKYTNGSPTQSQVGLKLAYHLTYTFNSTVNAFNDVTYFPSLARASTYLINADIGLHAKLTDKLFSELRVEWNYDSLPANGAEKNDERYIASLGYTF
jgi:putative salt-induced outer membrane protein YdiY